MRCNIHRGHFWGSREVAAGLGEVVQLEGQWCWAGVSAWIYV